MLEQMQVQEMQCNYPGCEQFSSQVCAKCYKSFCTEHIRQRRKKYICEFCVLLEAAQGSSQKKFNRFGYIACGLISLLGIVLLILGQNALGVVFLIGGLWGMAGVSTSWRPLRPTRM